MILSEPRSKHFIKAEYGKFNADLEALLGFFASIIVVKRITALSWLEKSFERHEVEMTWLQEEPILEPVRSNKRYLKIYNSMDFNTVNQIN